MAPWWRGSDRPSKAGTSGGGEMDEDGGSSEHGAL